MRNLPRGSRALVLCAAALATPGCIVAAVAVGAAAVYGGIQYSENEAWIEVDHSLDDTWTATLEALNDNGYSVSMSLAHGPTDGHIDSGDAIVDVTSETGDRTRVSVRVGTFRTDEHRRRASLILERVVELLD